MRIIEVECDTLDQVAEARDAGVDVVMVDNMSPDEVRKAVEILEGSAKVEVERTEMSRSVVFHQRAEIEQKLLVGLCDLSGARVSERQ